MVVTFYSPFSFFNLFFLILLSFIIIFSSSPSLSVPFIFCLPFTDGILLLLSPSLPSLPQSPLSYPIVLYHLPLFPSSSFSFSSLPAFIVDFLLPSPSLPFLSLPSLPLRYPINPTIRFPFPSSFTRQTSLGQRHSLLLLL